MSAEIHIPPNLKDALVIANQHTIAVTCPHCKGIHHHAKEDLTKLYVPAVCGKGYYRIAYITHWL